MSREADAASRAACSSALAPQALGAVYSLDSLPQHFACLPGLTWLIRLTWAGSAPSQTSQQPASLHAIGEHSQNARGVVTQPRVGALAASAPTGLRPAAAAKEAGALLGKPELPRSTLQPTEADDHITGPVERHL